VRWFPIAPFPVQILGWWWPRKSSASS